ncbi:hypothetical protein B0T14DRAFT_242685 [Immersiella caudata]|uniref:Uncharacterized protein n=1 Tax=Immersiella caudata TaxID=314043 RepID=A0AA39WIY1_9PEZI|nr:hypothetical protein B0T14DRAFT_242685 [Immersiella caudata]
MRDNPRDAAYGDEDEVGALVIDADADSEKSSVISDDDDDDGDSGGTPRADPEARPLNGGAARSVGPKARSPRLVTTQAPADTPVSRSGKDATAVSWRDLPRKDQLIVLTLARLSEPLVQTSLQVPAVAPRLIALVHITDAVVVVHVLHAEMVQPRLPGFCHFQPGGRSAVMPLCLPPDTALQGLTMIVVARASLLHSS